MRFGARDSGVGIRGSGLALLLIACCALEGGTGALAAQTPQPSPDGVSVEFLDRSVNACTDFYSFACGNWIARNPLPSDRSRLGRIQQLADRNAVIIREILERAAAKAIERSDIEQKIGDYYASCMDQTAIQAKGPQAIRPLMREIDAIRTREDLIRVAARFARRGIPSIVRVESLPDLHDSTMTIAHIQSGVLGLPDRDLYLENDERSTRLRREYQAHLVTMMELLGDPSDVAERAAVSVMDVETVMARAMLDRVSLRDPRRRDNPMTIAQLTRLGRNFEFLRYFRELRTPAMTRVNVVDPGYVKQVDEALMMLPLASWQAMLKWRVFSTLAPLLSPPFERERFRFTGTVLSGTKEPPPRWKRCTDQVAGIRGDDQLGELVGQLFVAEHFGDNAKARMAEMIQALEHSLERNIRELEWMTPDTRQRALAKLSAISNKIGAPARWRDFSRVRIVRNDLVGNVLSLGTDNVRYSLAFVGKKTDSQIWTMTPQTVNAYYSPSRNEVVFPAGILQPPFFDPAKDAAINFGAIGSAIGHELSHGFDDQGRKYDGRGNLTDWWAPADDTAFRERAACVSTQYSSYQTVADTRLNGELTLGENMADNAGVRIAYYALMEYLSNQGRPEAIDGFTAEQRFFIAWAQVWCENATDQDLRRRAQEDPHSSGRWRANGVLQNSEEFRKAFGCAPGTPMAPVNACRVW